VIAYILPTRDRPAALARTLAALGGLPAHDAEVVIVDNASSPPPVAPVRLDNGLPVTLVIRSANEGAAARNAGARAADPAASWIVMLDDDSAPIDLGHLSALAAQPADVLAVAAEIFLPTPAGAPAHARRRESGGLPEVFIGCGTAVRRQAFLDAGGYDPSFHFYAEEYDLSARLLLMGGRVATDRRFRVLHHKTSAGRSMDTIVRRLVRNNAWVMQRYAPDAGNARRAELRRTLKRYWSIAAKERAQAGYLMGRLDLWRTLGAQPRREMDAITWDRFTGKAACRLGLATARAARAFDTACLVARGKNDHIVAEVLAELGVRAVDDPADAEALVIATLSPGPMLDAADMLDADPRIVLPWLIDDAPPAGVDAPARTGQAGVRAAA
jgi:GT2 family glycosyltransferase